MIQKYRYCLVALFVFLTGCIQSVPTESHVVLQESQAIDPAYWLDYDDAASPTIVCYSESFRFDSAKYIVRGKVGAPIDTILQRRRFGDVEHIQSGYTRFPLEITQVYKGRLSPGDTVNLLEPYYIEEIDGKIFIVNSSNIAL